MIALILSVLVSTSPAVADTVVVLGTVERDLTGDGTAEVLRLVGAGESIDSLDVTFSIASAGTIMYQTSGSAFSRFTPGAPMKTQNLTLSDRQRRQQAAGSDAG
jgi:hypothetical protein